MAGQPAGNEQDRCCVSLCECACLCACLGVHGCAWVCVLHNVHCLADAALAGCGNLEQGHVLMT